MPKISKKHALLNYHLLMASGGPNYLWYIMKYGSTLGRKKYVAAANKHRALLKRFAKIAGISSP